MVVVQHSAGETCEFGDFSWLLGVKRVGLYSQSSQILEVFKCGERASNAVSSKVEMHQIRHIGNSRRYCPGVVRTNNRPNVAAWLGSTVEQLLPPSILIQSQST